MASTKDTPRQKLIGMMYLVLTALLAMNVSKDILNSFVIINQGLENNHQKYAVRMNETMEIFEKLKQKNSQKVTPFLEKAKHIQQESKLLQQHITLLKQHLIAQTDKLTQESPDSLFNLRKVSSKDNYDVPTFIMIGSDPGKAHIKDVHYSALQLQDKMLTFKQTVMQQFDTTSSVKKEVQAMFDFSDIQTAQNAKEPWHLANFYHIPLAAVVTNLSKIQSDVQNMEEMAIRSLLDEVNSKDHHFDQLEAKVVPNSNYVLLGDSFSADIFLAASSSTQDPLVEVSQQIDKQGNIIGSLESTVKKIPGTGRVKYSFKTHKEGIIRWGGLVKIQKPGLEQSYETYQIPVQEFIVSKPALVVSPLNMNVVYRGIDNPVSIAVPGIPGEKLQVTPINCSISSQKEGIYQIKPGKETTCKIQVSTKGDQGIKALGSFEFRVKNVPAPKASMAKISGSGSLTVSELEAYLPVLGVSVNNPDFVLALNYKVKSFEIEAMYGTTKRIGPIKANGSKIDQNTKSMLQQLLKPGCRIYITDIVCEGPNGIQPAESIKITVR